MLIDFGLVRPFLNEESLFKEHIVQQRALFSGNMEFGSPNAFRQVSLSRRDDLISLCYLLEYFFNGAHENHTNPYLSLEELFVKMQCLRLS
jgi:hypothetical protein